MPEILPIARKELWGFFASPMAYIFLGAFLAVNLFVFFWVEAFFARNLADARPLFQWMPVLLIFLVAALTMRLWSEERRAGTQETLLTLPVSSPRLVLGKFLAALALVAVALALTLPLPLTVSLLGPLDWGPVLGAYLATLLLSAAYIAIGLFISARTDDPIVSLIGSTLVCGLFFLLGSDALTGLVGHRGGELLALLGSGSRFESITRGVIDLRDLYFYLSIVGLFLAFNVYSLEKLRWAEATENPGHHRRWALVTGLLAANLLAANLWLHPIGWARADITQGRIYSISEATRNYLAQLREPLLIRGYFSARTHPLLAPLVPQVHDLLREYEIAGGGRVRVEFINPMEEPELEREAGERYGIRPVAFQTASKYQAAVVNSYFDLLVQYGDQHEKLSFGDLIEVRDPGEGELEVRLRNPEHDITRTIKKLLYGYQGGGDIFQGLTWPVAFHGYISPVDQLPEPLPDLLQDLRAVLAELAAGANGKFTFDLQDPAAGDGALGREIQERFSFQPLILDLLNPEAFYFSMVLESGDQASPIPLPEELNQAGLRRAIEAGIKRFAPGFLKTVALYTPPRTGGGFMASGPGYSVLEGGLTANLALERTTLDQGAVPEDADLLLVAEPENLDEKQVFAIDQFLMQGGTVILAASPYHLDMGESTISARSRPTGLEEWLTHQGLALEPTLVLDRQSTPFPIPTQREVAGFLIEEIQKIAYPYFPDIRNDGMDQETGITSRLGQITLNWASPLEIDPEKNRDRRVTELLKSSAGSWTDASEDIQPDFDAHGPLGFAVGDDRGSRPLAVVVQGRFGSFFAGKPSPLLEAPEEKTAADDEALIEDTAELDVSEATKEEEPAPPAISGVVETSPPAARLILIGSSSFLTDTAISLATEATRTLYTKPLELIQNAVDWSLEDRGLLSLRGRGQYSRLLRPLTRRGQIIWEYLNYALALAGLALVYGLYRRSRSRRRGYYRTIISAGGA
ncbi:MAG: Gliding motility-associated ABC transporter permease protein GldF / Gliding motility-associated ABC transporter substrate-binding protein GldG [Olavius algarvensis Gamma 1 endosymbiont]|nr:MAG: Gliding motility-associated ABC transporter permease protein GldF / Gliding motility-associated ABC transporter substrate-binding protein GldG [Olavius algarvensis Gamma 1 endosymbiont]